MPSTRSANILVVDDEIDILNVMSKGLEYAGFNVDSKNNPIKALSEFEAGKYHMVLVDIRMPQMDGFDLFSRIIEIDSKVKVCFLTGFDIDYLEKFKKRFPNVPMRCFIRKPISIRNLVDIVRKELKELNAITEA